MKRQKLFNLLNISLLFSLVFTSCNVSKVDDENNNEKETTIYFWHNLGRGIELVIDDIVNEFNDKFDWINVVPVFQDSAFLDDDLLENIVISSITPKIYPDIVISTPKSTSDYIDYNVVLDMTDYIYDEDYGFGEEYDNDYIDAFVEQGSNYIKEGIYSLPFLKFTQGLFYNKDVILGLDLSSVDKTINNSKPLDENYLFSLSWDEFFNKLAPALMQYSESVEQIIFPYNGQSSVLTFGNNNWLLSSFLKQYELPFLSYKNRKTSIDFNNENVEELLIRLNNYLKKGYISTTSISDFNLDYISLISSKTLFYIGDNSSLYFLNEFDDNIGVSRIFKGSNDLSSLVEGYNLSILDHEDEDRALASFLFIKYLLDDTNSYKYLNFGCPEYSNYIRPIYSPFKKSTLDNTQYNESYNSKYNGYVYANFKDFIYEYNDTFYCNHPAQGRIYDTIDKLVYDSLTTEDTSLISSFLEDAEKEAKQILL